MRKALTYTSFLATSILVILAFVTATTFLQLGIAVVIYPFVAYFAYRIFMVRGQKAPAPAIQIAPSSQTESKTLDIVDSENKPDKLVADIDKRAFLKVIGATGISFFLFSLLNRRTESLFFGGGGPGISSLTDDAGNKINPAERQPTDSYTISEIDDEYIAFYGFTNKEGAWFIMREDPEDGSFRYAKGESDFAGNWSKREEINYDYYHNVF